MSAQLHLFAALPRFLTVELDEARRECSGPFLRPEAFSCPFRLGGYVEARIGARCDRCNAVVVEVE